MTAGRAGAVIGMLHGLAAAGAIAAREPNAIAGDPRVAGETDRSVSPEGCVRGAVGAERPPFLAGLGQETILRGGFQPYPRAGEQQLRPRPAIHDACVIGVPQDVPGELVCACAVSVERAVATGVEHTDSTADATTPATHSDPRRFFDTFPTTGRRKVKGREIERAAALDHNAMSRQTRQGSS